MFRRAAVAVLLSFLCLPLAAEQLDGFDAFCIALSGLFDENNGLAHDTLELDPPERTPNRWWRVPVEHEINAQSFLARSWGVSSRNDLFIVMSELAGGMHSVPFAVTLESYRAVRDDPVRMKQMPERLILFGREYLEYADSDRLILGWDLARIINLARWGLEAGLLTRSEAWDTIRETGRTLAELFSSWEDFGANYLMGRAFWQLQSDSFEHDREWQALLYFSLIEPSHGVWASTAWPNASSQKSLYDEAAVPFLERFRLQSIHFIGCRDGNIDMIELAARHKTAFRSFTHRGLTSLIAAARTGDASVVRAALASAPDLLNTRTVFGRTALSYAVNSDLESAALVLIDAGADPNTVSDRGWSPILSAVYHRNHRLVTALLDAGADPDLGESGEWTPLLLAIRNDIPQTALALLRAGADPAREDSTGRPPIIDAGAGGFLEVFLEIVDRGAPLDVVSDDGWTPLMFAVGMFDPSVALRLLEIDAPLGGRTPLGSTALHLAIQSSSGDVVLALIRAGIDTTIEDDKGRTALQLARERGFESLAERMEAAERERE